MLFTEKNGNFDNFETIIFLLHLQKNMLIMIFYLSVSFPFARYLLTNITDIKK